MKQQVIEPVPVPNEKKKRKARDPTIQLLKTHASTIRGELIARFPTAKITCTEMSGSVRVSPNKKNKITHFSIDIEINQDEKTVK